MPSHLVIANPVAGRGLGEKRTEEARLLLDAAGLDYELKETDAPGHGHEIARAAAEAYETVVALGGDGTIQEVAGGLVHARMDVGPAPHPQPFARLGILPAGTGNDLIKALELSTDFENAVKVLLHGQTRDMDIGRLRYRIAEDPVVRERIFTNNVGLGFEGQVGTEALNLKLPLRGTAPYGTALLRVLGRLRNPRMKIRLGEGSQLAGPTLLVSIGNGHTCGGGFRLTPDADLFDGYFNLCVISEKSPMQVLRFVPRAMKGTHGSLPGVSFFRDQGIEVESEDSFHGHADGELLGEHIVWARVEILPGYLPVIT